MLAVLLRVGVFVLLAYLLVRAVRGVSASQRPLDPDWTNDEESKQSGWSQSEHARSHAEQKAEREAERSTGSKRVLSLAQAYAVLDLPEDAAEEDVEERYKRLLSQYHPDKVSHLGEELVSVATTKTRELNEAYQIIKASQSGFH